MYAFSDVFWLLGIKKAHLGYANVLFRPTHTVFLCLAGTHGQTAATQIPPEPCWVLAATAATTTTVTTPTTTAALAFKVVVRN